MQLLAGIAINNQYLSFMRGGITYFYHLFSLRVYSENITFKHNPNATQRTSYNQGYITGLSNIISTLILGNEMSAYEQPSPESTKDPIVQVWATYILSY